MSGQEKYNEFGAADIHRYLEGKMTPEEMNRLEKAALEDPFLADAIEGMQHSMEQFGTSAFDEEIAELRERLAEPPRLARLRLAWWKVAAVLVSIVTGVAITYFSMTRQSLPAYVAKKENFKKTEATPKQEESAEARDTAMNQAEIIQNATKAATPSAKPASPSPKTAAPSRKSNDNSSKNEEAEVAATEPLSVTSVPQGKDTPVEVAAGMVAKDSANVVSSLEGRVAGVSVESKRSAKTENLNMADTALAEVVVVGYGASRKRRDEAPAATSRSSRIVPDGGWKSFDEYINSRNGINTADSVLHGTEEVSFNVNEGGIPDAFTIHKSISKAHDEEVIKMLKEGPSWKIVKGKTRKLRLRVHF